MKAAFAVAILSLLFAGCRKPGPPPGPEIRPDNIVCNMRSRVAHRGDCRYAMQISPESCEIADSIQAAQDDGYRPCGVCKPWPRPAATQPVTKTKEK